MYTYKLIPCIKKGDPGNHSTTSSHLWDYSLFIENKFESSCPATATYKLVAVVVHKSLYFGMGHYIAFVRSRLDETHV